MSSTPDERECGPRVGKDGKPAGTRHVLEFVFAGTGYKRKAIGSICDCGTIYTLSGGISEQSKLYRGRVFTNKTHMVRAYG